MSLIDLCERGLVPDALTRLGIRRLCAQRLREEHDGDAVAAWARFRELLDGLRQSPLAIETEAANRQHYEVPARFFELSLGKRLKYSSCYYPTGRETLDQAEEAMLALYGERAELADGMRILELGCGWGSLTLWMAERFPNARILGVSNSASQREHILGQCAKRGLNNVEILTRDVNVLDLGERRFDRVVSVEMFEHVRNYRVLFERISGWLDPGGKLFCHIFCHRELMYPFETEGEDNWMGRYFFTGGLMPAADTFLHFQEHLRLEEQWRLSGTHYERTSNHWLENQDRHADEILRLFEDVYGKAEAKVWAQRWRMFWMACAELFGYAGGNEWLVAHYRFQKR
ncbi:cyclopropane-fatty-acyl-phospholipid synthase family protein [uncultured Aquimonas sp.]|uniref:SAM-dependent methyltransferase n=1 Tax=uncultured Aquimonas sp. TaxID=385483 RepID=UPI00086ED4B3|nr:cyclopropane-fatty-acyl-phospholipid synthase family protein [uncultured Aquimonas sp.]ODU42739.1 MAG: cyclopropane-fatty-acyl-phospholipid synthase [Xanthomonadaceae bacterium SCN 69-123]